MRCMLVSGSFVDSTCNLEDKWMHVKSMAVHSLARCLNHTASGAGKSVATRAEKLKALSTRTESNTW
jgi:predicted small secreted protein